MTSDDRGPRLPAAAIQRGLIAAALAWAFPGAGHLYLGARRRAAVFLIVVTCTVGLGLACEGNLAVVDQQRAPVLSGLQVFGNLAIGPLEPIMRNALYGALVYRLPSRIGPVPEDRRAALEFRAARTERRFSLYGTAYLMAAGLMNLLLMLDAWDIGIGRRS